MTDGIGTRFEKYVQGILERRGRKVERNIVYHRGDKTRQADLEFAERERLFFKKRVIVECKYVGNSSSLSFDGSFDQLASLVLFAGGDEGLLVTNAIVPRKEARESEYHIRVYDISDLLELDFGVAHKSHAVKMLEHRIRKMPYDPKKDHVPVHRYL